MICCTKGIYITKQVKGEYLFEKTFSPFTLFKNDFIKTTGCSLLINNKETIYLPENYYLVCYDYQHKFEVIENKYDFYNDLQIERKKLIILKSQLKN